MLAGRRTFVRGGWGIVIVRCLQAGGQAKQLFNPSLDGDQPRFSLDHELGFVINHSAAKGY